MFNNVDELRDKLIDILGCDRVYYNKPSNFKLVYPCIILTLGSVPTLYSNNLPYLHHETYDVMLIEHEPNFNIRSQIRCLPTCQEGRHYIEDKLNHTTFDIYIT